MSDIIRKTTSEDEVNLFNYMKIVTKRKKVFWVVLLSITTVTAVVNFLMPKIYRGEFWVHMATNNYADLVERINSNDQARLKDILPKTFLLVDEIELMPLPDTVFYRLKIFIDAKDTADIHAIKNELFDYLAQFPFYKKSVEQKVERLQKELDELSKAITYMEDALKTYNMNLKNNESVSAVLNPVEVNNGIADLIKRKIIVEQLLKNNSGLEIISEEIYSNPVKPKLKRNITLAALIGLLSGIFIVFMIELKQKVSTSPANELKG